MAFLTTPDERFNHRKCTISHSFQLCHCVSPYVHIYHADLLSRLPLPFLRLRPHLHVKNESEITFYRPQNAKESKTVSGKIKQENAIQSNIKHKNTRENKEEIFVSRNEFSTPETPCPQLLSPARGL